MEWQPWTDVTDSDYMDISYVSQVNRNLLHVRNLVTEYLMGTSLYSEIDTSKGYQTQPLPEYLNRIENNINNIEKKITWVVKRQKGRTWLGEDKDDPTFRYSDVNRWFSDLLVMKLALDSIPLGFRKSGTFSCGDNYLLQLLRR